ncbi:aldo/keto reductase [Agrococcus versicolor]|uniref:Aldo/keto reductase n=1 Tax=Agrococcus versicolor TaxID=501482 RepID=A0ABP5MM22_9MICO
MRIGLGLAALGRPGYITRGHDVDLPDRTVDGMRERTHAMLDAAWDAGVRFVDAARGYGLAEQFLGEWLSARPGRRESLTIESKWGYAYTADWRIDAEQHERKDHSLAMLERQWDETCAALGTAPDVYLVHSVTPDSGVLGDDAVLARLRAIADGGVRVGLSTSGPRQAEVLLRALEVAPLGAVQATWNVLERSVGDALVAAADAGWTVVVKEALANGAVLDALPGDRADAEAIGAALAIDPRVVVLSGAVTPAQLAANLAAVDVDGAAIARATASLVQAPQEYWRARSAREWR